VSPDGGHDSGDRTVPRLNVPKTYHKGISALLSLAPADFDLIATILERQPGTTAKRFDSRDVVIPSLERSASEEILNAIIALYRVWASTGDITVDSFVADASDAIATFDSTGNSDEGKARLRKILDIEPLARSLKAFAVLSDNEHDFHDAKILTDIRYAFRPDPDAKPYGAVIVHMLKVTYHQEAEHKSFHVALDGNDLKQLKATIERAEKKEQQLKKQIELTQTHYFPTGDE
jgi:hypothetical protein